MFVYVRYNIISYAKASPSCMRLNKSVAYANRPAYMSRHSKSLVTFSFGRNK